MKSSMSNIKGLVKSLEPGEIKKAVISASLQSPVTLYSGVIAGLSCAYGALFSFNPLSLGIMTLGAVVSFVNVGFQYKVNGDGHANRVVASYRKELNAERTKRVNALKKLLSKHSDNVSMQQVDLFTAKFDNFVGILDQKLNPGELTYNRYLTIAEQVFLGGLDNLSGFAISRSSVQAIDIGRIHQEIARLDGVQEKSSLDMKTYEELQTRMRLYNTQMESADKRLLENEHALTQLDHVSTRIAEINTKQGHAGVDLEDAMDELKYLIEKADQYSN